ALMRDGLVGSITDDQRGFLDIISDRADDLNTMVDDMLDVGRLEAGRLGAWRKRCAVSKIIGRVRPALERKAIAKSIQLSIETEDDLPEVYCDDEKAARVLINLTVNAIKFCQEENRVRVTARKDPQSGGVIVAVADNGPGIDPAHRDEIFERFKQLNIDPRASCKGFGLGLNIAKVLVDLNFGDMDLQSTVGQGSTFTFTLPPADPIEVMRRWVRRLKSQTNEPPRVSLVSAQIDSATEAATLGDVDWYLNSLLRRNDLLFRIAACRWLLVVAASDEEVSQFLAGAHQTFDEVNRNRPQGPLPAVALHAHQAWSTGGRESEFWAAFREQMEVQEPAYA
ncbi:MAG TPA: HAMP domain-containing sensor histidine kinase, partial [Pirellulales bacterium]|nr:HAMP domain-containing sensor histidine kinase [Pirellulales bacterium]